VSRQPYHINQGSQLYSDLITVLRLLGEGGTPISLFQRPDGKTWVLGVRGKTFEDLSLNRVIERAGRELTTVFDR
jgi:hypothetical protein